jgi:hypothetical protein
MSSRPVPPHRLNPGGQATAGKQGDSTMSAEDKAKNTAEKAKGKVKEGAGKVTGNESLAACPSRSRF